MRNPLDTGKKPPPSLVTSFDRAVKKIRREIKRYRPKHGGWNTTIAEVDPRHAETKYRVNLLFRTFLDDEGIDRAVLRITSLPVVVDSFAREERERKPGERSRTHAVCHLGIIAFGAQRRGSATITIGKQGRNVASANWTSTSVGDSLEQFRLDTRRVLQREASDRTTIAMLDHATIRVAVEREGAPLAFDDAPPTKKRKRKKEKPE